MGGFGSCRRDRTAPVRVGLNSITADYEHDAQEVTYTSGPYAGKQILFGCSEGRGLDIYDVTNIMQFRYFDREH